MSKIEELNDAIGGAIWFAECMVGEPRYTVTEDGGYDLAQNFKDLETLKEIAKGENVYAEIARKVLLVIKRFKLNRDKYEFTYNCLLKNRTDKEVIEAFQKFMDFGC